MSVHDPDPAREPRPRRPSRRLIAIAAAVTAATAHWPALGTAILAGLNVLGWDMHDEDTDRASRHSSED